MPLTFGRSAISLLPLLRCYATSVVPRRLLAVRNILDTLQIETAHRTLQSLIQGNGLANDGKTFHYLAVRRPHCRYSQMAYLAAGG